MVEKGSKLNPPFHLSRRGLACGVAAVAIAGRAQGAPCTPLRILFVCPAGTVKSAIARETLRRRARALKVPIRVESRGLKVEDHVSPGLAERLRQDGLDPKAEPARPLTAADPGQADIVIAFDEAADAPELRGGRTWQIPSWNDHYDEAKAALASHVDELLAEAGHRSSVACQDAAK